MIDDSLQAVVSHTLKQRRFAVSRNAMRSHEHQRGHLSDMHLDTTNLPQSTPFSDTEDQVPPLDRSQSTGIPANGNLVVNTSVVQKVSKRKYGDLYSRSVSRSMVSMGVANQYVHLTQRTLPAVVGSRVRGVEMLPSGKLTRLCYDNLENDTLIRRPQHSLFGGDCECTPALLGTSATPRD